jgi:TM2 domain-containing membrane protein YozV
MWFSRFSLGLTELSETYPILGLVLTNTTVIFNFLICLLVTATGRACPTELQSTNNW